MTDRGWYVSPTTPPAHPYHHRCNTPPEGLSGRPTFGSRDLLSIFRYSSFTHARPEFLKLHFPIWPTTTRTAGMEGIVIGVVTMGMILIYFSMQGSVLNRKRCCLMWYSFLLRSFPLTHTPVVCLECILPTCFPDIARVSLQLHTPRNEQLAK